MNLNAFHNVLAWNQTEMDTLQSLEIADAHF